LSWFGSSLGRLPLWRIGSYPEAEIARVAGVVDGGERVLEAPLTGRTCVYYAVRLHGSKLDLATDTERVSFAIRDGTGRALIDPADAQIDVAEDHVIDVKSSKLADPRHLALLARHNINPHGWMFPVHLQFHETVIAVGSRIAVGGACVREPDPDEDPAADYRGAPPTRLRFAASAHAPLLIGAAPPR
jgi:hypothetical protein